MKTEVCNIRPPPTFIKICFIVLILVPTGIILFRNIERPREQTRYSSPEDVPEANVGSGYFRKPEDGEEPELPARSAAWQPVHKWRFYVYSAFYDDRGAWSKTVRIVAAAKALILEPARCKFWYENGKESTARVTVRCRERSNVSYTTCFVECPFVTEMPPHSVSIITIHDSNPKNRLLVIDTTKNNSSIGVGVCATPLQHVYNNSVQLVEFMELNKILGMKHVTFYKTSITTTTDCILRAYEDEGRATVLLWNDYFLSRKTMKVDSTAALNDCLYRNMHNFTHLAFLGVDEFIVPAGSYDVPELIEKLDQSKLRSGYKIGSYNFRNGFFWMDRPNHFNASSDVFEKSLTTLLKTWRRGNLYNHGVRSKYIVKPTKVLELGNNLVAKFVNGYNRLNVPKSDGILNSYTKCGFGTETAYCDARSSREDKSVLRYKKELVATVKMRWSQLQEKCKVGDIQQRSLDTILYPYFSTELE